jgi:predicted methyltransferase
MTNILRVRVRFLILMAAVAAVTGAVVPGPWSAECQRERWQKVDEIFEAMDVRPGATVADIGAGGGFFTTRLSKAVEPGGRVFAVDVSEEQLQRLREKVAEAGIVNVTVVEGAADDPRLPPGTLDAALIVNAYHEMNEHQAMLGAIRRALKPDGRLVLVEPISDRRRGETRAEQVRSHEIAPEHAVADARAAGFRIVGLRDPFTKREHDTEWLLVLQPEDTEPASPGHTGRPRR